jgi:hypothetical protein
VQGNGQLNTKVEPETGRAARLDEQRSRIGRPIAPREIPHAGRKSARTGRKRAAKAAGRSEPTIKRFETGLANVSDAAVAKMVSALDAAGVEFTNGDQPGVRLKRARPLRQ